MVSSCKPSWLHCIVGEPCSTTEACRNIYGGHLGGVQVQLLSLIKHLKGSTADPASYFAAGQLSNFFFFFFFTPALDT